MFLVLHALHKALAKVVDMPCLELNLAADHEV